MRSHEGWDKGIYQNPLLAFNFEKISSWANVSSTFGSGWTFLNTLWLRGFRSTQMCTPPDLGTTTIPAHQGEGSDTLEITPAFSILSSSSVTLGRRGNGTCHGVKKSMWFGIRAKLDVVLSGQSSRPWKTFGNFFWMFSAVVGAWRESALTARCKTV